MNYIFTHFSGDFEHAHRNNERGILRLFESAKKHLTNFKILFFTQNQLETHVPKSILEFADNNKDTVEIIRIAPLDLAVGMHCQRYCFYYIYLKDNRKQFKDDDKFFHIDASDVIFQGNIFDRIKPDGKIHVFYEDQNLIFNSSYTNTSWIEDIKPGSSEVIGKHFICCSGTVLLDNLLQFENFLLDMSWYILRIEKVMTKPLHDQALYNLIIHGALKKTFIKNEDITFHNNEYPELVYTMQGVTAHDYTITETGVSVNDVVPCVLHQYDRHKDTLFPVFNKIYNLETT